MPAVRGAGPVTAQCSSVSFCAAEHETRYGAAQATSISGELYWSGRRDLNPRPPVPQTGALTGLRHAPTGTAGTIGLSAPVVLINEFDRMLQPCRKDPKGLFRGQSHQDHPIKVTSNSVRRNLKRVSAGNRARWGSRKLARGSNHNFRASTLRARSRCEKRKKCHASAYWRSRAGPRSRSRSSRRHTARCKTERQTPVSSWSPLANPRDPHSPLVQKCVVQTHRTRCSIIND